jgi:hypothetical protein
MWAEVGASWRDVETCRICVDCGYVVVVVARGSVSLMSKNDFFLLSSYFQCCTTGHRKLDDIQNIK